MIIATCLFSFTGSVKTIFEEELGVVDLHLSNKSCVLYVSESDLVAGNDYKRKIARFRNVRVDILIMYFPFKCKDLNLSLGLNKK